MPASHPAIHPTWDMSPQVDALQKSCPAFDGGVIPKDALAPLLSAALGDTDEAREAAAMAVMTGPDTLPEGMGRDGYLPHLVYAALLFMPQATPPPSH